MDVRVDRGDENIGNKVIFHTRVHLSTVPPFALHIQIVDGNSFEILWPATDGKSVAPACVYVRACVCAQNRIRDLKLVVLELKLRQVLIILDIKPT